jgi:DNA-binding transcriptional MerR regulator
MSDTIAEAARKFGMTAHTLRYYDKEGLLPFVERDRGGRRVFKDSDLRWLEIITCLKNTGMPLKKIKEFIATGTRGVAALKARLALIKNHQAEVEAQLNEMKQWLKLIKYKVWYYETAVEAGTVAVHETNDSAKRHAAATKKSPRR